jgi:peptidoglycan hydrolase-like protein with peptidoglycan-binding domain
MEDTTAALPITAATLITAGTPTTAAPIMAVIRTVRTAIATLTDTGPTIMGSSYPSYYNRSVYRGSSGSTVARVQERLARSGYYRGSVDGVMGPRTRYAIRVYERRHGLPADGIIDRRLLATMGIA